MNCPCIIRIGCKNKKLYIMSYEMHHNHPVTAEIGASYPENRRLTEDQQKEISDILFSSPDNLTVKRHIEDRFGKSYSLNEVRQLKYQIKRRKMAKNDINQVSNEGDFQIEADQSVNWNDQQREGYRFGQFEPVANELADLVCSADQENFYERLGILMDLVNAWRSGKHPVLVYGEDDLIARGSADGMPMNTEVVKTSNSFPCSKPSSTYLDSDY